VQPDIDNTGDNLALILVPNGWSDETTATWNNSVGGDD